MLRLKYSIITVLLFCCVKQSICSAITFVEAESFGNKGGWVVDQQFMDQMGSPYLLAHGMGTPVSDASTQVTFGKKGKYDVYVRTYNWTSPWSDKPGPGKFRLSVDNKQLHTILGEKGNKWEWQKAGTVYIEKKQVEIRLSDMTGFDGRIDAVCFVDDPHFILPESDNDLAAFRRKINPVSSETKKFDLVVAGGGIAGICTAVSAARLGLKVALINNRPIWGGNNSSEVRVHLGGYVNIGKYPRLGNLLREFGPSKEGNAQAAANYEDEKKQNFLEAEKNISLYPNFHVYAVKTGKGKLIQSITATHIETGNNVVFESPLFVDCTGDGTVGFLAGADYAQGCEAYDIYKESLAPKTYEKRTMGASVQWYSRPQDTVSVFPEFNYGITFTDSNCQKIDMGEWTWETGMNYDQIAEFERIRDYGLLVVYSNWSYLKNKQKDKDLFSHKALRWVAYVAGKRESRRLLGDIVLTENDLTSRKEYADATAATSWTIDLHYPDPENSKYFAGEEFKSIAKHVKIYPYDVPYRCLYSRNIPNLFMAGRHISVSHVALGTVRVMRTLGMLGEVVGMGAYICNKEGVLPREVYPRYLDQLQLLMTQGMGKDDAPDNQKYNEGETLQPRKKIVE